jgi:hypothetical protein
MYFNATHDQYQRLRNTKTSRLASPTTCSDKRGRPNAMNEEERAIPTKQKGRSLEDAGILATSGLLEYITCQWKLCIVPFSVLALLTRTAHRVFPNHCGSVSQHEFRYLCLYVAMQSSVITYLPVEQLHSRAKLAVTMFQQGGGSDYIDKAIHLDRVAMELCPPGHPMRSVSLTSLAEHLGNRYDQLGATRDLEEAIVLDREALNLRRKDTLIGGWL